MNFIESSAPAPELPWFVVRVKANFERKVARSLDNRGVPIFLPLVRRSSKRIKRGSVESPLFPGYVFAQFDCRVPLPVLTCPGVVHILCRGTLAEPVDPVEMHALQSVSRVASVVEPLPAFTVGQKVRISGGPLADVEGIVVRDAGRQRLIVSVTLLQRSVAAEIDREWLQDFKPIVEICALVSAWNKCGVVEGL